MAFVNLYLEGRISNEAKTHLYMNIRTGCDATPRTEEVICGKRHKLSAEGKPYSRDATAFCRTEDFWDSEVLKGGIF